MTAPVIAEVCSDMEKRGGSSESTRKFHHQLSKAYTKRQNKWVVSLLLTFSKHQVCLAATDDEVFRIIITGQIFSNEICYDLIGAYDKSQELRKIFADERLKPDGKVGIFVKLKKCKVKTCKSANKAANIKYKDQVAALKEENVFISRIAMIRGKRDVDMKSIIGNFELTPIVHSLMKRDGTLLDGWEGKADLFSIVRNEAQVSVTEVPPCKYEAVAIDAMFVMNQISTKPVWIKTGNDLAKEFCNRVDQQTDGAEVVIIGFEWYSEDSLKAMAWKSRNTNKKLKKRQF